MKEKILIVDDEITSRRPCGIALKSEGYQVDEAEDGEQALKEFKKKSYDLVITDLRMPGISGMEVLKQIKGMNSTNCPVIMMTAYAAVESGIEAIKLGAYDYLIKPVKIDVLLLKINRCLQEQRLATKVKELDEIIALYKICKAMFLTNMEDLSAAIVDSTLKILHADDVSLLLFDTKKELNIAASGGISNKIQKESIIAVVKNIALWINENNAPVLLIGGLENESRLEGIRGREEIKSIIVTPLTTKTEILGIFSICRIGDSENFTENELHKAVIFASQLTSAVENAKLFRNLEQEKEKIEAIFTSMGDGAIITDSGLNIIIFNQTAQSLLDLSDRNCRGKYLFSVINDFDSSISLEELKGSKQKIISFDLSRKTGKSLFIATVATRIINDKGEVAGYVMTLRDATEERTEMMLKKTFISTVSHKLRTPLTGISTALALFQSRKEHMDKIEKQALDIINEENSQLTNLVDKLIRFTTLEAKSLNLNRKETALYSLIESSLVKLSQMVRNNQVKIEISKSVNNVPSISVDYDKMQEVFQNLIENAIKFNEKDEKEVKVTAYLQDDGFVRVEVKDNGAGIPSEEHNKIFQKFYQVEEYFTGQVKGAGLGLSLVKKIIEAHKGKVWVESRSGEGSKFIFILPA